MIQRNLQVQPAHYERLGNLELLKALAIIAMIFCHPVIRLGIHRVGYEKDFLFFFGDIVLGCYLCVAHAFMFAMGVGVIYTDRNSPADLARRGIWLYLLGYVLNFCRYGVYALADGLISGVFEAETLESLFGPDILQFAGLALLFTALLKKLKLRESAILAVGLLLSAVGTAVPSVDTGSFGLNWLLGHLVYTTWDASCFVFCSWYCFVAAGLVFGSILRRTKDQDLFCKRLLIGSGSITAIYLTVTCIFGTFFLSRDRNYYALSALEAAGLLSIDHTLLSVFYFLLKKVEAGKLRLFFEMSRNLTPIYFIHWCILGCIDSIVCYLLEITFSWAFIYGIGLLLIVLSFLLARLWRSRRNARKALPPEIGFHKERV